MDGSRCTVYRSLEAVMVFVALLVASPACGAYTPPNERNDMALQAKRHCGKAGYSLTVLHQVRKRGGHRFVL